MRCTSWEVVLLPPDLWKASVPHSQLSVVPTESCEWGRDAYKSWKGRQQPSGCIRRKNSWEILLVKAWCSCCFCCFWGANRCSGDLLMVVACRSFPFSNCGATWRFRQHLSLSLPSSSSLAQRLLLFAASTLGIRQKEEKDKAASWTPTEQQLASSHVIEAT